MPLALTTAAVLGLAAAVFLLLRASRRQAQIERLLLGLGSALKEASQDAQLRWTEVERAVEGAREAWTPRLEGVEVAVAAVHEARAQGAQLMHALEDRVNTLDEGLRSTERAAQGATTRVASQLRAEWAASAASAQQEREQSVARMQATLRALRDVSDQRFRELAARLERLDPSDIATPSTPATQEAPSHGAQAAAADSTESVQPEPPVTVAAGTGAQEDIGERWIFLVLALLLGLALLANGIRSLG